jgi:glycosyltransferase involved in cell wall biosynthesis
MSLEQTQQNNSPLLSIIIPVYNAAGTLNDCYNSIKESGYINYEIIMVDDASTDNSLNLTEDFDCKIIKLEKNRGANFARNTGAESAKGEILVFMDSDVMLRENTLQNIVRSMKNKKVGSVVGIYAWEYRNENFISQYKNLWIRYSYLKSSPQIDWVFGAISAIRKELFFEIGGFNYNLIARDGNDDIELGKRFAEMGCYIFLNTKVEVFHLKKFTLVSLLKNEFYRSLGFASLAVSFGETGSSLSKGFVNVYPAFIVGTLYSWLLLLHPLIYLLIPFSVWISLAAILLFVIINIKFLNFFEQARGFFAMLVVIPVLFIDELTCLIGSIFGTVKGFFKFMHKRNKNGKNFLERS